MYIVKTPWWLKRIYPSLIWNIPTTTNQLFLTFDDGPHETATPFVLDTLRGFNAKATFFCIGKNVIQHSHIYNRIISEGHSVGNHTYNHFNGWKTNDEHYVGNITKAAGVMETDLFRPPYGRIKKSQIALIKDSYKIIMWDVLSGDFDIKLQPQKCLDNVIQKAEKGSIVVFHDSQKAFERLSFTLPKILDYFSAKGFTFLAIPKNGNSIL